MSTTATITPEQLAPAVHTLRLRPDPPRTQAAGPPAPHPRNQWWQTTEAARQGAPYPYAHYEPTWDSSTHYEPLTPFELIDPGHQALQHAEPRAFLRGAEVEDLTPDFGSEVKGVELHKLDKEGREQLALYVAQRGVVVSRQVSA